MRRSPRPLGPSACTFPVYLSKNRLMLSSPTMKICAHDLFNCLVFSFAHLIATAACTTCATLTAVASIASIAAMATMTAAEFLYKRGTFTFVYFLMKDW